MHLALQTCKFARRKAVKFLFLIAFVFIMPSTLLAADKKDSKGAVASAPAEVGAPVINCQLEISYKWKRRPPSPHEAQPAKGGRQPSLVPTPDPELYQSFTVLAEILRDSGKDESDVKESLANQVVAAKSRATKQCQETHQTPGMCLAKSIGAMGDQFDRLDFESKRAIRNQLVADCDTDAGVCLNVAAGEITCKTQVVAVPPAEAPAAGKDAKKK